MVDQVSQVYRKRSQFDSEKAVADQNVVEECVVYPVHELEQLLSQ